MPGIRPCRDDEGTAIVEIVNAAAEAYRGVIPADRHGFELVSAEAQDCAARELLDHPGPPGGDLGGARESSTGNA